MHGSTIGRIRSAIIGLVLLLATLGNNDSCDGLQYQPVDAYANGDHCALVLDNAGRTSVFDYTYNLLRGSLPTAAGSQTCITYDAVNRAYIEARKRINVAQPRSKMWRPEDLATVGELLLDISTNLAQTYGLTFEEIDKLLPLIDTSKTLIRDVCPAFLSDVECRAGKYRRNDGLCTNLRNPTWGSTLSPFQRLLTPRFADGLTAPRISATGRDLPLSRVVSRTMHPDEGYHDHAGTVMVIAWGQFMDHDYTLTGTPLDPLNRNDPEECCHRPPHLKNPYCNEIHIPEDDYFYRLFRVKCMDFVRAFPAVRPNCRLGSRVPFNLLTGVLDGNTVYGITEAFARKLRTGYGGLLRMNPVFSEYGLKDLLPLKLDIPDEGCTRPNRSMYCFEAGEIRVNEQLVLTCMHTLMAREHNRIAKTLTQINPHWDDETLFQESRRIIIAQIQQITYNEFLPILLGKEVMEKFGLLLEKDRYWDGYDESVNPAVIDAFASAAFRFGHSLLPTAVERWSKAHKFIASKRLSDLIRRPYDLYRAGVFDEYIMGLMNQVAQAMDDSITQEVTNHLFKKAGAKFGLDLVSFNMQRGREFGIPSYMEFRKFCGLPWADTFDELFGSMPNETIRRYSSIFERPADVDLWSGGVSERPLPGSMLGPTFACVIATQFSYSRRGDRFWYELPNQPSSFTLDQLNEIRKVKLARVICDNTDLIDTIQIYPMVLPDHEINPRVPCRSGVLPSMDLSKWAEYPTTNHAQYNVELDQLTNKSTRDSSRVELIPPKWNLANDIGSNTKMSGKDGNPRKEYQKISVNSSSQNLDSGLKKVASIDEIVNSIRQRYGSGAETFETLNNQEKRIALDRSKRSLETESGYAGVEQLPSSNKFYRHPNLSYEEQKRLVANKEALDAMHSSKESKRHTYVPVFPECNDADNSEVDDLNASPPKHLKNPNESEEDDSKDKNLLQENSKSAADRVPSTKESQKLPFDRDPSSLPKSLKGPTDRTYINIQDHQRDIEETTSSDMPAYDPKKIPYVDVPDYSDIREESLDEEDRPAGEEDVKGGGGVDPVDPGISANRYEPPNSTEVSGFEGNSGEEVANKHSGREEETGHFKKHESDGSTERDDNRGSGKTQQQNSTAQLEAIIFDIDEYRKPFNLDEFLKDDPIMKKLELLGKETRAMYRKGRKQVPSFFNESESDNTSAEWAEERGDFAGDRDGLDFFPKSRRSSDFVDILAKIDKKKAGKNGDKKTRDGDSFNKDNSNEEFLRPVFRKDKRESGSLEFRNEGDFRTRQFAGDAVGSQQEDGNVKGHRGRKDPRGKGGIHVALFPILNEKSRVSRLNEQVDKWINARNNSALVYKNFWSPGYNSLNKKADMEAQEKRK